MSTAIGATDEQALAIVAEVGTVTRRLVRLAVSLRKARAAWDFAELDKAAAGMGTDLERLAARWTDGVPVLQLATKETREHTRTPEYLVEVETALGEAGIPFKTIGEREYEFPPFKLSLNVQEGYARLSLGRKSERTTVMAPGELATWVRKRYDKVVKSRFDAATFKKELLAAYQVGNRAKYGGTVQWGNSVELGLIYDLFTLRHSARQDYPRQLFLFDLARLREEPDLQCDGHRFEFGFARNQDKVFSIVDRHGREARLASLIVYGKEA